MCNVKKRGERVQTIAQDCRKTGNCTTYWWCSCCCFCCTVWRFIFLMIVPRVAIAHAHAHTVCIEPRSLNFNELLFVFSLSNSYFKRMCFSFWRNHYSIGRLDELFECTNQKNSKVFRPRS